jgi:aerobic-type carbon monoxide dehydrogenase small subunit (CoxS/CutS family)
VTAPEAPTVALVLDGEDVEIPSEGTLLDALRDHLGHRSVKDGCSPQGQCGCCTVLVDGVARVACVTPSRRMAGKEITTLAGLDPALLERLEVAFEATGASQCGFCTPGILARLVGLARRGVPTEAQIRSALGAHLCRCTGLQPIVDAALRALDPSQALGDERDPVLASRRASLESGVSQLAGRDVVRGAAGFSADRAPAGALVALASAGGGYTLGASVVAARRASAKVQGRSSTIPVRQPVEPPEVDGAALVLATAFVEPAYVEPDASWCEPGGEPSPAAANAGAFGAKRHSAVAADARRLADEHGQSVLAVWPREEVVRRGKKRPPVGLALRPDGSGAVRVGVTPGSDDLSALVVEVAALVPAVSFELVEIDGPPVGSTHRGALLAEVLASRGVLATAHGPIRVETPNGAWATADVAADGAVQVSVGAGAPLCAVTLESYVTGAVHHALGMVRSEGIAVGDDGEVHDLTVRSFGCLSASETPRIEVSVVSDTREPLAVGTAVFAATLAAAWRAEGLVPRWPTKVRS